MNGQLENVSSNADTLCETLGKDAEHFAQLQADMERELHGLDEEVASLKLEINAALNQHRAEEARVKTDVLALKNQILDTAKKTISMHKDVRSSSHNSAKHNSKELLSAMNKM